MLKYLQSLTIKGIIGTTALGVLAQPLVGGVFDTAERRLAARCERQEDNSACLLNLQDLRTWRAVAETALVACGLTGAGVAIKGRERAKGPLGVTVDQNRDGIPDILQRLDVLNLGQEVVNKELQETRRSSTSMVEAFKKLSSFIQADSNAKSEAEDKVVELKEEDEGWGW